VPYAESLRKLDELKVKLNELQETLKELDNHLTSRGLSPEDQALLDKHKSLQNAINSALAKNGHQDSDEAAALPDAEEERRRNVANLYRELSPEDQALIDKHKSLKMKIDAALGRGKHTDADEDAALPDADEPEEQEKKDVSHLYRQLSPEDQALINKYQSLKDKIAAAFSKVPHTATDEDAEIPDEEETVLRRGNANVFTFMAQLPEEDQDLLKRMRSKIPNLQLALDKKHKRHFHEDEEIAASEVSVSRRGNGNVFTYISGLPEEDQQLLKRMRSKLPYLQLALDKKNKKEYKRAQEEEESLVRIDEDDEKLAQFEQSLSPDDLALLKAMKSKLHFLKEALHADRPQTTEEESASQTEAEMVPGVDAGPLEDRREAKMDGWNEKPSSDSDLQERCPCQKQKQGSEKRCACDKDLEERCPRCHDEDAIVKLLSERCPTCHNGKTPDAVVEEVETRLLKDIDFAQANGVKMEDLVAKIKAKLVDKALEERELEQLVHL
jgi:hypothetical protein